jgi:hypothetical protein
MKAKLSGMGMVVLILFLMISCGPSKKKIMDSWIGQHRDDLIRSWGPPSQEVPLSNGGKILSYLRGGGQVYAPMGNMIVGVPRNCRADFESDPSGRIINWRYEGHC